MYFDTSSDAFKAIQFRESGVVVLQGRNGEHVLEKTKNVASCFRECGGREQEEAILTCDRLTPFQAESEKDLGKYLCPLLPRYHICATNYDGRWGSGYPPFVWGL